MQMRSRSRSGLGLRLLHRRLRGEWSGISGGDDGGRSNNNGENEDGGSIGDDGEDGDDGGGVRRGSGNCNRNVRSADSGIRIGGKG